jgi:hypothetical protein
MTQTVREPEISPEPPTLEVPGNATFTSDYPIPEGAWVAYLNALDRVEDMAIALEIRARPTLVGEVVELDEFTRQQGYDPADLRR